jgi:hypothetical protein
MPRSSSLPHPQVQPAERLRAHPALRHPEQQQEAGSAGTAPGAIAPFGWERYSYGTCVIGRTGEPEGLPGMRKGAMTRVMVFNRRGPPPDWAEQARVLLECIK